MTDLTAARLRELLHYDPETGQFIRRVGRRAGNPAGVHLSKNKPRLRIKVDGELHYANRLAWLYVHGEWPAHQVDHINGDATDDRIVNLRDVPHSLNQQNQRRPQKSNSTGFLGVTPIVDKRSQYVRYRAKIGVNGVRKFLGLFATPEEAHAAYIVAKRQLHPGCTI